MNYYIYILLNEKLNRKYIGCTNNLDRRLREHNAGKTKSTKAFRPWKIVYAERYNNQRQALDREKYLKSGVGREIVKDILNYAHVAQQDRATVS